MTAFPINWGFGGIALSRNGPMGGGPKLYVCLRFADHAGRPPIGFTAEWLTSKRKIVVRRIALRKPVRAKGFTSSADRRMAMQIRYHKKTDGILRIGPDGRARFLTLWETVRFWFGGRP